MQHKNRSLKVLSRLMSQRGIYHVVLSPGSRNAPLIQAFGNDDQFSCYTIVDERSAAFFALGIAQQLQKPVAIVCTSGSAVLNLAPAIAEAYYQRVPLLVLTADRPPEMIDQGFGQTIRQQGVFANFVKKSFNLPEIFQTDDELNLVSRLCSEALNVCLYPVSGPVHINIPLSEPLYSIDKPLVDEVKDFEITPVFRSLNQSTLQELVSQFNQFKKVMVLVGQSNPDPSLEKTLKHLVNEKGGVVLSETTSNLYGKEFISWIDRCLEAIGPDYVEYGPELLITCGTSVISKKIKFWLKNAKPKSHWHIDLDQMQMDTYGHLKKSIPIEPQQFFSQILPNVSGAPSIFQERWFALSEKAKKLHAEFMFSCPYSDLKVFEMVLESIPPVYDLQLANSTAVRYAQLFDYKHPQHSFCNRGVSGIDGSFSTALGAAVASGKPTVFITGDLGFLYDSNALWNKHYPKNLKTIVINNGGGGIFRILDGLESSGLLEDRFEASHTISIKGIVEAFWIIYLKANDVISLGESLDAFFKIEDAPVILEVFTSSKESAFILKDYFLKLKS